MSWVPDWRAALKVAGVRKIRQQEVDALRLLRSRMGQPVTLAEIIAAVWTKPAIPRNGGYVLVTRLKKVLDGSHLELEARRGVYVLRWRT